MDVLAAGLGWPGGNHFWESSALRALGFLEVRCDWLMVRLALRQCLYVLMMLNLFLQAPVSPVL